MKLLPDSKLGKWAVWTAATFAAAMICEVIFAVAIGGNPAAVDRSLPLRVLAGVLSVMITITAPLSLILGLTDLLRNEDWRVIRTLAILYAAAIALFLIGEGLFAH